MSEELEGFAIGWLRVKLHEIEPNYILVETEDLKRFFNRTRFLIKELGWEEGYYEKELENDEYKYLSKDDIEE